MEDKFVEYCLIEDCDEVEKFLKEVFKSSSSKIKKYFPKALLNKSFKKRSCLKLPLNFVNDGLISPLYVGQPLKIISEDEHFLVFEKEANQFIHPLTYDEGDNCLSWLRNVKPELLNINQEHYDRGLIYRLDYETSGLVVFAKSDNLYKEMREHFHSLVKEKIYLAWVQGHCTLNGSFTHSFSSREEKGKRVVVQERQQGKQEGELSIKVIRFEASLDQTLVEVSLKTGLRHQIRAQLAYLGFPLVGDEFYGGRKAQRLYLHAFRYQYSHLKKLYKLESNPLDFSGL
jgi:23S rRNA pseudouridine1911/1915/1917 synthase